MPSLPMLVLALVLGVLYAAVFHAMKGETSGELPFFAAASLAGIAAGQTAASLLHNRLLMIGELHVVEATALSLIFISIVRLLRL